MSEPLTPNELSRLFPNASKSCIRANAPALDRPQDGSTEQVAVRPLEHGIKKRKKGKGSVAIHVSLVSYRRRLLDPDAVAFSHKKLVDCIAEWLCIDDADPRVRWEWHQVQTNGPEGVAVKIEIL